MTFRLTSVLFAAVLSLLGPSGGAWAQFSYDVPDNVVRAEVLPGWSTGSGTRMAALHLILAPGWKTYWRAPGDAGIPAQFDWSRSGNLSGVQLHWPTPSIFIDYGVRTIGYADRLVLPMELRPARPGEAIRLSAVVELGVCERVCIPMTLSFSAELDGDGGMDPLIRAALSDRPMPAEQAGVEDVSCELAPISDGMRLDAAIRMPRTGGQEVALVEAADPSIWVSEPEVARRGETLHIRADLVPAPGDPLVIERGALRFTVIGTRRAVDIVGCR